MIFGQCPIPLQDYPTVVMAHGGGGRMTQMLLEQMFLPLFHNPALESRHDGAIVSLGEGGSGRLAFTTDSSVVHPRFFPGGDIGTLAIYGTVNDLAMCGAQPLALSTAMILEEGLPMEELWRVAQSLQRAAAAVGVPIVTGDTKVVDRGKGDGLYLSTAGIGLIPAGVVIGPERATPGDVIILSGEIGSHGVAILSVREGLAFETELQSDSAPLHGLVAEILRAGGEGVHVLRDPTRGGVASTVNEIAAHAQVGIRLDERVIPIGEAVRGACELLGLDPLYVANEGKCIAIVAPSVADAVVAAMRAHPLGTSAAIVGEVVAEHAGRVWLQSRVGGRRIVDMLSGEQLPRIC